MPELCIGDDHILLANNTGVVVSQTLDICLNEGGVPVPFMIVAFCGDTEDGTVMVRGTDGIPALTLNSRIHGVYGNEEGVGGGIFSHVNSKNGWCKPIDSFPTVSLEGFEVLADGCEFLMNCNGPEGTPNTIGKAIYMSGLPSEVADFFRKRVETSDNILDDVRMLARFGQVLNAAPSKEAIEEYKQLLKDAPEDPWVAAWGRVMLDGRDEFHFQGPEGGQGPTNFDYYSVEVKELPRDNYSKHMISPKEMLASFRYNMDRYHNRPGVSFKPYPGDPKGDLVSISLAPGGDHLAPLRASVLAGPIVGDDESGHFRFSTVYTPNDGSHAVRGTREFGYYRNPDGSYTFYTSGVDRFHDAVAQNVPAEVAKRLAEEVDDGSRDSSFINEFKKPLRNIINLGKQALDGLGEATNIPIRDVVNHLMADVVNVLTTNAYKQADLLWRSWMEGFAAFVNGGGGSADFGEANAWQFDIDYGC